MSARDDPHPKVVDYIEEVKDRARNLVKTRFPEKILELNALLDSPTFDVDDLTTIHQQLSIPVPDSREDQGDDETPTKKRKIDNDSLNGEINLKYLSTEGTKVFAIASGPAPCNKKVTKLINLVKPHIRQLVESANLLKMWITFLIPKIEDGNNFGVSIQEDTLGEIRTVEAEAATFYEQISRYYLTRGKIISKVAKYPHVEDYRQFILELDEKEFLSLRLVLSEVRNHYATLYDLITKNIEKIVKPRTTNHAHSMY